MVSPQESQEIEEPVDDLGSADPDVDEGIPSPEEDSGDGGGVATAVATDDGASDVSPDVSSDTLDDTSFGQTPPPAAPQVDQAALRELQERRASEVQRQWRDNVGQQARSYAQRLEEAGYMPEQARDQARRYIQQEQKFRQQEQEAAQYVGFVEGRQAAAVHFMQKHGLANKQMINDLMALQKSNTPVEMEREAQRLKRERALVAENARLKQGRVAPQTFDNSQGSAEASPNDHRLLDAYNNGDRSEAAVRAARRLALGN